VCGVKRSGQSDSQLKGLASDDAPRLVYAPISADRREARHDRASCDDPSTDGAVTLGDHRPMFRRCDARAHGFARNRWSLRQERAPRAIVKMSTAFERPNAQTTFKNAQHLAVRATDVSLNIYAL